MQLQPGLVEVNETDTLVKAYRVNEAHIDFSGLIEILLRRWGWIVGALALALTLGLLLTALQQRKYAATTEIFIYQQAQQQNGNGDGLVTVNKIEGMAANRSIRTQIRLLHSGAIIARALASLPEKVRKTGFRNGPELLVQEPAEGDNVLAITVKALTPQAATALANSLVQVLIEHDIEESSKTTATALAYVSTELRHVDNELNTARRKLAEFEVKHGVAGDDEMLNQHMKDFSQLQSEADQVARTATTSRQLAQALQARISGQSRTVLSDITEEQNPLIDKVDLQIDDLESRRLELRQVFAPDAPEIKRVEGELLAAKEHRAQLLSTRVSQRTLKINPVYQVLEQQYLTATIDADSAEIRLGVLQRDIAIKRASLTQLPPLEMQAAELQNNVNLLEATSTLLSKNFQSLRVNKASRISNVRVLNSAYENPVPVSPDTRRNLLLSLVFGILLAVTITMALEALDNRYSQRTVAKHHPAPDIATDTAGRQRHQPPGGGNA